MPLDASTIETDARRSAMRWAAVLIVADIVTWSAVLSLALEGAPRVAVIALGYAALSLLAVCVLYVLAIDGSNPGPVLKGDRLAWLQPLFIPYRIVAYTITALARALHLRDPVISEIGPGLFMGVRLFSYEGDTLRTRNIRCVVDLTSELPTNRALSRAPFQRYAMPTLDRCPPTLDETRQIADWVAERHAAGDGIYIHCAFGRGRSATIAAAVCLRLGWANDADGAIALVAEKRPVIRVRGAQYAALHRYADQLAQGRLPGSEQAQR